MQREKSYQLTEPKEAKKAKESTDTVIAESEGSHPAEGTEFQGPGTHCARGLHPGLPINLHWQGLAGPGGNSSC